MSQNFPLPAPSDGFLLIPQGAQHSAAAERNRQPILERLQQLLPAQGVALEIASGTGQHAAGFAAGLPRWQWQPSDRQADGFASIAAWCAQAGVTNVRAPVLLDVLAPHWPLTGPAFGAPFDAVFCANMLHISPWATCAALMQGAARHLAPDGQLLVYGPFLEADVPTSPGNQAFDASLREQDPAWGLRPLDAVQARAQGAGLMLHRRIAMPANNLLLVFRRAPVYSARIAPDGEAFAAPAHQPLLASAQQAGIDWPASCRNGTCRTCAGQLVQGRVRHAVEWPGLSAEEKAAGWLLPCVAHPESDLVWRRVANHE